MSNSEKNMYIYIVVYDTALVLYVNRKILKDVQTNNSISTCGMATHTIETKIYSNDSL